MALCTGRWVSSHWTTRVLRCVWALTVFQASSLQLTFRERTGTAKGALEAGKTLRRKRASGQSQR